MPTLPENPGGTDLEHLVAAHFVSRGCFVESPADEEEAEYCEAVRRDIERQREKGWEVVIPTDQPDVTEPD